MDRITAAELQRGFGRFRDRAQLAPLIVTRHGRDDLVLISAETYRRLVESGPAAAEIPPAAFPDPRAADQAEPDTPAAGDRAVDDETGEEEDFMAVLDAELARLKES